MPPTRAPRPAVPARGSTRYAAFLRGVMPTNAKMEDLRRAFEKAGFTEVKTVLASGNVVFSARPAPMEALERKAEAAMKEHMGRSFPTIVRSVDALRELLASDPYRAFRLKPGSKRVVTFLRGKPRTQPNLPVEQDGARIFCLVGSEAFSAYVRDPKAKGPVFMMLIERTLGTDVTTRTWDTIMKVVR